MNSALFTLDLSNYERPNVTNLRAGREAFNHGLRLLLSYQHELAAKYFLTCVEQSPNCALAHALIACCHGPNYNFKGTPYYKFSHPGDDAGASAPVDLSTRQFPCQLVADRYSSSAVEIVKKLETMQGVGADEPQVIEDVEAKFIAAIRLQTCNPGVDPSIAEELNDRPFAAAMHEIYKTYPNDPEIAYFYVGAVMTLYAWRLFEYPTGRPLSEDVPEVKKVLEEALQQFPQHVGLCHLYCHLCEMSAYPEQALAAGDVLRTQ